MDSTIQALGGLLLRAVPTFILVFLLHFYLKWMFFNPLNKVLKERRNLTEGAREAADAALRAASEKTARYEAALNDARAEIHRTQEETRNVWLAEQTRQMDEARPGPLRPSGRRHHSTRAHLPEQADTVALRWRIL